MANQPLSMMKLKALIHYKEEGRTNRFIGKSLGLSRTTVVKYVQFLESSGLSWAALLVLDESSLLTLCRSGHCDKPDDRWSVLSQLLPHYVRELKRPHVTRQTLLEEYQRDYPGGYGKTQFLQYLREHLRLEQAYQPIEHKAGEKLFIDYAGDHLYLTDRGSGEQTAVEVFICVLGCSGLVYAEASMGQTLGEFSHSIQNALHYIGGVTACLVPDNLKSAVNTAHKYEPKINERFTALARHYNTAVVPARPRAPKDKSKVENGVQQVYRRIFARLRNEIFHALPDLNTAIRRELEALNALPMQGRKESRQMLFEHLERQYLRPLPPQRFVWKHQRIALHTYNYQAHGYSTTPEHMPSTHRFVSEWSEPYFIRRAHAVGPQTTLIFEALFRTKDHPEQAFRSCVGILALAQQYGHPTMEIACREALERRRYNYAFIHAFLEKNHSKNIPKKVLSIPHNHQNLRGPEYYKNQANT